MSEADTAQHNPTEGESEADSPRQPTPWGGIAGDWLKSFLIALMVFLVVRTFVVEAFKIPTSSMENTLLVGDFLLVNKAVYGGQIPGTNLTFGALREPERGDLVVFHPPHDPGRHYVKRVVGMPEDTLEMRDKGLYVNGIPLEEPYARHVDERGRHGASRHGVAIESSDRCAASGVPSDSRQLGAVGGARGPLFHARGQQGQQRGFALLGIRAAQSDPWSAVARVLLTSPYRRDEHALVRTGTVGSLRGAGPLTKTVGGATVREDSTGYRLRDFASVEILSGASAQRAKTHPRDLSFPADLRHG